ncbi:SPFH/Band 7/PHB domain protein, partial [Candidatus Sumerlaeota bacterium]|nr:SPFH/Band 7/PHB domain protein [Candidatus Sumerlaeota bacterium]
MIFFIVAGIVVFIIASMGIKIVRPWEKGLIERLGKYQRTARSGLTVILPFLERIIKVDMREQVVDVP